MNLHGLASGVIAAVNPMTLVSIRISIGSSDPDVAGKRTPLYATPGAFVGSIAGAVLTAGAPTAGALQVGQTIAGAGVTPGTKITALGTGTGGAGTYSVAPEQTVASTAMTTAYELAAQVQSLSYGNLRQVEGLNLGGVLLKAYCFGQVEAIVRAKGKGGDLLTIPGGVHAGTYLVNVVFEQFPDWCSVGLARQA